MSKFLYVMSKGFEKSGGATPGHAVRRASTAEAGHHTEVFLIDDAIHWAQWGMAEGIRASTGEHMKDLLDELVAAEAPHPRVQGLRGQASGGAGRSDQRNRALRRAGTGQDDDRSRVQGFHLLGRMFRAG